MAFMVGPQPPRMQPPPPLGGMPSDPGRSRIVTAIGIINFVFSALEMLCGMIMLAGGALAGAVVAQAAKEPGNTDVQKAATVLGGAIGGLLMLLAGAMIAMGIMSLIAGVGVVKRKNWGRTLTLVLGCLAGIMALINLSQLQIFGVLIDGGYCAFVLAVLLQKKYAAEFS